MILIGIASLVFSLIFMGAAQAGFGLSIMYLMHKKFSGRLPGKKYGEFDFDSYDKLSMQNFLLHVAIIFMGATFVLHMLVYVLVSRNIFVRHTGVVFFFMFVLEIGAIAGGLYRFFQLDVVRLSVLAASSAIIYLVFQWMLYSSKLLL